MEIKPSAARDERERERPTCDTVAVVMARVGRSLLPLCVAFFALGSPATRAAPSIAEAQAANQEAHKAFQSGDLATAIKEWERAYAALPTDAASGSRRAQLSAQLATTHKMLYDRDGKLEHLDRALELYRRALDELGPDASQVRSQVQTAFDQLTEERARLAERATSPAESAPSAAHADPGPTTHAIRAPGEKVPLLDPHFKSTIMMPTATTEDRRPWRLTKRLGVTSLALAVPALVGVGVSLGLGERADRLGETETNQESPDQQQLQELRVSGQRANGAAIVCGALGGVFIVTGVVLLVVDGVRPTRRDAAWRPTLGGFAVRF